MHWHHLASTSFLNAAAAARCCRLGRTSAVRRAMNSSERAMSSSATSSSGSGSTSTSAALRSWTLRSPGYGAQHARAERLARGRGLHTSAVRMHEHLERPAPGTGIKIHFVDSKSQPIKTIEGNEGDSILDLAHEHDIDLEGACEGSVACSTCHVILSPAHYYDLVPEPEDDENDMLDMAFGLTDTSRLGCQVKLTRELDGMTCMLPAATRNMYVDGAKPTAH